MNKQKNRTTINDEEITRFSTIADEWWDEEGKFKPLHLYNPFRLQYIKDQVTAHFKLKKAGATLQQLKFLDIGCGGGLLSVPLARQGMEVLGIDASEKNIHVANAYKNKHKLGDNLNFICSSAEELARTKTKVDVITALEVVEHVDDLDLFIASCEKLLKPNGLLFISTINRTIKSYFLAIVGAEYIMRWLPIGTHTWNKFLTPAEIEKKLAAYSLKINNLQGVKFLPISQKWVETKDLAVNYILSASK